MLFVVIVDGIVVVIVVIVGQNVCNVNGEVV